MSFLTFATRRRARREKRTVADPRGPARRGGTGPGTRLIARTLGDPTLQLGLWFEEQRTWVDEQGRELELPPHAESPFVGEHLAVLVHDPRLLDQPELLESVGSAGAPGTRERAAAGRAAGPAERAASRGSGSFAAATRSAAGSSATSTTARSSGCSGSGWRCSSAGPQLDAAAGARLLGDEEALASSTPRRAARARARNPPGGPDRPGTRDRSHAPCARAPVPVERRHATASGSPAHVETTTLPRCRRSARRTSQATPARPAPRRSPRATGYVPRRRGSRRRDRRRRPGGLRVSTGLADRVGALGGTLSIDSPAERGTRLLARIPADR